MFPNNNQGMPNNMYGQFNPYNSSQYNRLAQMEQQQMNAQQQQQQNFGMNYGMGLNQTMPQTNYLKGRPVVSIEEARAAQIDLDGSMHIFTDFGNKKIYTKQINLDGTASLNTYTLEDNKPSPEKMFVTRGELETIVADVRKELLERSDAYAKQLESYANVLYANGAGAATTAAQSNGTNGTIHEQPSF